MSGILKLSGAIALLGVLAGCADDPYRNVYEGIRQHRDAEHAPRERAMKPAPSYDNYKREREEKHRD
ncbi:MAG: hypothetical protein HY849_06850 [Nitrosomonadales bacterium]|nr:hypothetical protein [Nitrosomonadales bacterium]